MSGGPCCTCGEAWRSHPNTHLHPNTHAVTCPSHYDPQRLTAVHARHPFAPGDDPSLCRACGQTLGKDWHTNAALDAVTVVVEANGEWCATTEGVYQARNLAFAFDGVARDCGPHRIEVWTREAAERAAVEHRRRWRASVGDADCWSLNPYRPDSWCHEPEGHDGDHKGFGEMWPR